MLEINAAEESVFSLVYLPSHFGDSHHKDKTEEKAASVSVPKYQPMENQASFKLWFLHFILIF